MLDNEKLQSAVEEIIYSDGMCDLIGICIDECNLLPETESDDEREEAYEEIFDQIFAQFKKLLSDGNK